MDLTKEIAKFAEGLKQQRDEIILQLHLAGLDAKKEFEAAEKNWQQFKEKIADIGDETKETGEEFVQATKIIGEELKSAYKRIIDRIRD